MKRKGGTRTPGVSRTGSPEPVSRTGALNPDEAALWSYAVRALEPLRKAKARVVRPPDEPISEGQRTRTPAPSARQRVAASPAASPAQPVRPVPPPLLTDLDRRRLRKLASGRTEIEARVDLHGLRQSEAHRRLRAFLLDAQARGLRSVLVITGKGGVARGRTGSSAASGEERGVIRRNVPAWLGAPDLRPVVVGFTPAHVRHGGEGALYVQLRRRRS